MQKKNYTSWALGAICMLLLILLLQNKFSHKKESYDATTVLNRISYVQELALVKFNYAGVIGYKDYMKLMGIQIPLTEKFFLLKYNGYLKAGVDLKKAEVKADGQDIIITLPKPEIFDTVIDEKSIKVYDQSMNPFNPISINEYNQAIIKEKDKMTQDAINQGILREASEQAHLVITGIVKDMGFKRIIIRQNETITVPERK